MLHRAGKASTRCRPVNSALGAMSNTRSGSPKPVARRMVMLAPFAFACTSSLHSEETRAADRRWIDAAEEMRKQALSWGDQAYGAVLVKDNRIIGYGPSRVVKNQDPEGHAEREAIKHALSAAGTQAVTGAILYSTSRPCRACEAAAAKAGVQRMYFGPNALDVGTPRVE
jgi:tRNA(Arg) A34 adenosine deaminase TadA